MKTACSQENMELVGKEKQVVQVDHIQLEKYKYQ